VPKLTLSIRPSSVPALRQSESEYSALPKSGEGWPTGEVGANRIDRPSPFLRLPPGQVGILYNPQDVANAGPPLSHDSSNFVASLSDQITRILGMHPNRNIQLIWKGDVRSTFRAAAGWIIYDTGSMAEYPTLSFTPSILTLTGAR